MKTSLTKVLLAPILILLFLATPLFALEEGTQAPEFTLKNLQGEEVSLSDFKGQVTILKLATTWCPTCKQQSQEFESIAPFLKENNVPVIEVFVQDTESMVQKYMKNYDYPFEHAVLMDDGQVARSYNLYLIPRIILLDKEHKVCRDGSVMRGEELKKEITSLVNKKADS